jgi:glutathione S-transferase
MLELYQIPWSPYCLVIRRLLEYSGVRHRLIRVAVGGRGPVWKLTRERYYQVPVLRDARNVIFETDADSQVIAKYLDSKLRLGLFPAGLEGVQSLIWRYIEDDLEGVAFKLNDSHWRTFVPARDQLDFLRFKERKFGRGCLDQWREQQPQLLAQLEAKLVPFEEMLLDKDYLLDFHPRFVDFDLWGILANFRWTGQHPLPAAHTRLADWYERMSRLTARP